MMNHKTALITLVVSLGACAHTPIPGTSIDDTDENRAVLDVLNALKAGMEERDADKVIALVSPNYYEDMGTTTAEDDYGYRELRDTILPEAMSLTDEFKVTFEVHEVRVMQDRAHADLRYTSRAHLKLPSRAMWDTHEDFNRLELAKEDGSWLVVRGL